jgi:hypothetical protein
MATIANKLPTSVTTPKFRVSYPSVFTAKLNKLSGKMEFSVQAIFEAGSDLKPLHTAAENACVNKWGADKTKWPKMANNPFKKQSDMIEAAKSKGQPTEHLNSSAIAMTFKTGATDKAGKPKPHPVVVGKNPKEIIEEESKFYGGCWAKANVNASAYSNGSNHGVTFYLNACQFVGDGERFGGRPDPEAAFEAIPEEVTEGGNDATSMFS